MKYVSTAEKVIGIVKSNTRVLLQPGDSIELHAHDLIQTGANRVYLKPVLVPVYVAPAVVETEYVQPEANLTWDGAPEVPVAPAPEPAPEPAKAPEQESAPTQTGKALKATKASKTSKKDPVVEVPAEAPVDVVEPAETISTEGTVSGEEASDVDDAADALAAE